MKYKFYTTSEKAWEAMLEAISAAQKSIFLEMYIFTDNTDGYNFFEVLKQKSQKGIKVKIIIDSLGSNGIKKQSIQELKGAGIEILLFSYWLQHTHKKILIIDENIAFIGGVNIHKLFKKWNDLQVRLEGPIVKNIIRSFARSYQRCGGKDLNILLWNNKKTVFKKTQLWILEHWKTNGKRKINERYKESIKNATKNITIITPYFAPRKWLMGELHQAILRGVNVEIIIPERTDHWIFDRVNYFYISRMNSIGIKFYLEKEMNHAKAMLVDEAEGIVGSHNIDPLSFDYNVEAGIFFRDTEMVNELKEIIKNWKNNSILFDYSMYRKMWLDYILAPIIRIFQSLL